MSTPRELDDLTGNQVANDPEDAYPPDGVDENPNVVRKNMPDEIRTTCKPMGVFVLRATSEDGYMEVVGAYSTLRLAKHARDLLAEADNHHIDFDIEAFDLDHMPDLEPKEA